MVIVWRIHSSSVGSQNAICIKMQINPNGFYSVMCLEFPTSTGEIHSAFWDATSECRWHLAVYQSIALNPTATGDIEMFFTLLMLILSLLRFTSVSSQTSASLKTVFGACPRPSAGRPDRMGGAFSWSLRCSPCRTSSVFSRSKSPGTGVTLTTLCMRHEGKEND